MRKAPPSPFLMPNNVFTKCQLQKCGNSICVKPNRPRGGTSEYLETERKWLERNYNYSVCILWIIIKGLGVRRARVFGVRGRASAGHLRIVGSREPNVFAIPGLIYFGV